MTNIAQSASALSISNIEIHQVDGLYSLNDLHRAAGGEAKHRPNQFMRLDTTIALISEIVNCADVRSLPAKKIEGRNGGTYACKELAIAYAAWISPAFNLKVLQVFLASMEYPAAKNFRPPKRFVMCYGVYGDLEHVNQLTNDQVIVSRSNIHEQIIDRELFSTEELMRVQISVATELAARLGVGKHG